MRRRGAPAAREALTELLQEPLLLCTPRKLKSAWSKPNQERVERLTAGGLMMPRGLELVALAKRTGAWNKLNAVEALQAAKNLRANPWRP